MDISKLLNLYYLTLPDLDAEYLEAFLACFKDSPLVPKALPGIDGDLQEARVQGYRLAKAKYVCFVDPDDLVDPHALIDAVEVLERNPTWAMYCIRSDELVLRNGQWVTQPDPYSNQADFSRHPKVLHNATVYRTEVVQQILPQLIRRRYVLFDWALRLVVSSRHPFGISQQVGYTWRNHPAGEHCRKTLPEGFVHPVDTIRLLIRDRLYRPTSARVR